jgi:uncharacterized membrane protein YfcA
MDWPVAGIFIHLDGFTALQVICLGFVGGTLSGFIGSGGAFFMTPGMMNLGIQGVVAVGSNITHKFGKAMVGSRKHGKMGNVDRKLAAFLLLTAFAGIRIAVMVSSFLFEGGADSHNATGAGANLYISLVFVGVLSIVSLSMLRDLRPRSNEAAGPSRAIVDFFGRLHLPPMVHFKVADVSVSLWILLLVGLATGYLAGTIGVGGFIGVPAMIYIFGIPTAVAAGTELYLAMFLGAFGALNYALEGYVDIRLTLLLYVGSLVGVHLGAYGVKVVSEKYIRMVTALIILLCVISRGIAVPVYLRQLGMVAFDPGWDKYLNGASQALLYVSGLGGTFLILFQVFRAYRQRQKLQRTIAVVRVATEVS